MGGREGRRERERDREVAMVVAMMATAAVAMIATAVVARMTTMMLGCPSRHQSRSPSPKTIRHSSLMVFFQGMPRAGCERRLSSLIAAGRRDWLFFLNAPCAPKIHPTGLVSRTHEDCFIDSGEPHADPR